MTQRAGFSLLEAIVATAILGMALIPLYALQQGQADAAFRLQQAERAAAARQAALSVAGALNPAYDPSGSLQAGAWTISWSAELVDGPRTIPENGSAGASRFEAALYRVAMEVSNGEERPVAQLEVLKSGWSATRGPSDALEF